MTAPLTELSRLLEQWCGERVSARIVTQSDDLAAVFVGRLGSQSDTKHPAAFWPLEGGAPHGPEQPGLYAHPDLLQRVDLHEGGFVIEYEQGNVVVNIRRLGPA